MALKWRRNRTQFRRCALKKCTSKPRQSGAAEDHYHCVIQRLIQEFYGLWVEESISRSTVVHKEIGSRPYHTAYKFLYITDFAVQGTQLVQAQGVHMDLWIYLHTFIFV